MSTTHRIDLGDEVRDVISGFAGTATGRIEYMTGCIQLLVSPTVDEKGQPREAHWYDEDRLEVTKRAAVRLPAKRQDGGPSGPQAAPRPY